RRARARSSSPRRRSSKLDDHPVPGTLEGDVREVAQRLRAEVRQQEPLAPEIARAGGDLRVRDVNVEAGFVRRAFADEEVGAARARDEVLRPRGVARVEDRAAVDLDPVAEGDELGRVRHAEGAHPDAADVARRPRLELLEANGKRRGHLRVLLVEGGTSRGIVLPCPLLSLSLMRPDPELLREGTRLAHLVLLSAAAGLTAERLLRPGLAVRGLALLVGLGGFYAGSWLWALADWSPGPALLGQPLLPPIV